MLQIQLRNTPLTLSQIAFGCGGLTGMNSTQDAVQILHAAFDAGITHFDVARSYGYGQSESILAQFLQSHRAKVTVTTKYGVPVASMPGGNSGLMKTAKRIIKSLPGIRTLARKSIAAAAAPISFSAAEAQASLDTSLRELRTDHVDLFLLHEATLADATKPEILDFLQKQITAGKIRAAGIGSEFPKLGPDAALIPNPFAVLQFQSNLEHPNHLHLQNASQKAILAHGSLRIVKPLAAWLDKNPAVKSQLQSLVNTDLNLPGLLLKLATIDPPVQAILFSTGRRQNLESNLRFVNSTTLSLETANQIRALLRPAFARGGGAA